MDMARFADSSKWFSRIQLPEPMALARLGDPMKAFNENTVISYDQFC